MAMTIDSLTPRGGSVGDSLTLLGSGFGPTEGTVVIGGQSQSIISWADGEIVFSITSGSPEDGTFNLIVTHADTITTATRNVWVTKSDPFAANVDFQEPANEAGPTQNDDLPGRAEAAIWNRLFSQVQWIKVNAAGLAPKRDRFTPSEGQTEFILSASPTNPALVAVSVNGIEYDPVIYFTVSGVDNKLVTWVSGEFGLGPNDSLVVFYFT